MAAPLRLSLTLALVATCSHPQKKPDETSTATVPAVKAKAQEPLPQLRTGALSPVQVAGTLSCVLKARSLDKNFETLLVEMPFGASDASIFIEQQAGRPRPWSGRADSTGESLLEARSLWVIRRAAMDAGQPVSGRVFQDARREPGRVSRFALPATGDMKPDGRAEQAWAKALVYHLRSGSWASRTAWHSFAAQRVQDILLPEDKVQEVAGRPRPRGALVAAPRRNPNDVARLMETTTGMTSLQEALQTDRRLLSDAGEKPSVELAGIKGLPLQKHPFDEMLKKLGRATPTEPLAAAAPADFYFVRFRSFDQLMQTLDRLDAWITPAATLLAEKAEDHDLSARYQAQLGLGRSALARALGPSVITDLAIVGSDPYLREGSDLTFVFRVKSKAAFDAAVASALAGHGGHHGGLAKSQVELEGVTVTHTTSPDFAVNQLRASVNGFELVSNSKGGLRRVLATIQGRQARLADEPDFRYMMGRDAEVPADVLAFMGDRFIANVASPTQKILEARRQVALAQLSTPGYAALLYGWITGRAPTSTEELLASRLLGKSELVHADKDPIRFVPGQAARSSWGSPAALTPLIDLPVPRLVSKVEEEAYGLFVRGYQDYWRRYIDPAAIRIAFDKGGRGNLQLDLRVLPLIDASDYRQMERMVGRARLNPGLLPSGLRTAIGIGADARLRRMAREPLHMLTRDRRVSIDWLGDWAILGIEDSSRFAKMLLQNGDSDAIRQRPQVDKERRDDDHHSLSEQDFVSLPLYAGLAIRSQTAAAIFLTGLRSMVDQSAPGLVDWGEAGRERDIPFVAVRAKSEEARHEYGNLSLYYTFCKGALLVSLDETTLRQRIHDCLDGRLPSAIAADKVGDSTQWTIDLALAKDGAFRQMAVWLLDAMGKRPDESSNRQAEILWRSAPDLKSIRSLALAYFGVVPLSSDGNELGFGPEGVIDPLRGSAHAPRWPRLPVAGSPIDRLLQAVGRARSEVSFDDEPTVGPSKPVAKPARREGFRDDDDDDDGDNERSDSPKPMRSLHTRLILSP
jgi:hypothetical protein